MFNVYTLNKPKAMKKSFSERENVNFFGKYYWKEKIIARRKAFVYV